MVTYYKVISDKPVQGKAKMTTVDLAGQEVCLKYQAEELEEALLHIRSIVKHTRACCSCAEIMIICDRVLGALEIKE